MAFKDPAKALEYWKQYNLLRRSRKQKQARELAMEQGLTHYFTGKPCKHGHITNRRVKDRICMGCDIAFQTKARSENPEKTFLYRKDLYEKHKEKHLAQKQVYRQNNKGKINALVAARKKVVKQRTPAWLSDFDKLKIKCVYLIAAMLTRTNKEPWHVDHVIPLQGKNVSGLHVPNNMQVMRGVENSSKKNKFEVNYA